ncbi:GntR family transcriptional regulator [Aureimonas altamirensis]|uniref:GntR family transcriptional regulator n=1 Tax=Aureimonas altamirensis TaxID=370622 RepID=A0A0B1PXE4_9HYPH|nr:PLP-dependent aminotransferase family protein [Aureimonas altamirensis]KHJ53193.1 GntR family transcriptional regulator [Aureimonas altamirensis]
MVRGQTAKVMDAVRARIEGRSLSPGARLPSVRAEARASGVSVSTVVEAYERLVAEGLIRSRPGSGFYVSPSAAPLMLKEVAPRRQREIDPFWISRQSLEAAPGTLMPGCGWLPADWMFESGLRRALRKVARGNAVDLADYGSPLGSERLRALLARRLLGLSIPAATDRIMLTESGTQAIDLVCRLLIEPGDAVLVDDPCYFNFHALLRAHRARIVGVRYGPDGPDTTAMESLIAQEGPRLYITNSAIHNPTGATLSPATAHKVVSLADRARMTIVEDDIFGDFEQEPAVRLAALDGLDRVICIGSFSKSVSASVRCGYVAARADWLDGLIDMKIATSFGGGRMAAALLYETLSDGACRRHMEEVRRKLGRAMDRTVARLERLGVTAEIRPRAGMFVWCRLPDGADAGRLASHCLGDGVVLAPGNAFSVTGAASQFMRFNVAQCGDDRIFASLERALR